MTSAVRLALIGRDRISAFSLVEVTISLGLVAFALVGILGALPLAMDSGRYSFEQTRASNIANTLFATMRTQSFTQVFYITGRDNGDGTLTPGGVAIDLKNESGPTKTRQFYAAITDPGLVLANPDAAKTFQNLLGVRFLEAPTGADFGVRMYLNNQPGGASAPTMPSVGMANQVELQIYSISHPKDIYHFVSVIANRAQ